MIFLFVCMMFYILFITATEEELLKMIRNEDEMMAAHLIQEGYSVSKR